MKTKTFIYRLLFTRSDDLDLLQVFFLLIIIYFMVAFGLAGAKVWSITTAAWATFGSVFATLAIAGTPKWIAELLSRSKLPGEVASGIGQAAMGDMGSSFYAANGLTRDDTDAEWKEGDPQAGIL